MFSKVLVPTVVILMLVSAGGALAVEINDTQTWDELTDFSGQTTTIGPNGDLTINARVNLDNGTVILNGGKLTINGGFHFGDSSDDSNPEEIYLYAGTMTVAETEGYRDRGAVVFVGAGEMITGQVSTSPNRDPSNSETWDIRLLEGYGPLHVDDIGDDRKRIWATPSNPDVEFDSAASGALESAGPATLTVCVNNPDEGESYGVDYCVTGGTATGDGVDYTLECGSLSFAAGESCKTVTIDVVDDGVDEEDETVEVTLSNPTGTDLILGDLAVHTYSIQDPRPSVGFGSATVRAAEDSGSADISIGLSAAVDWPVTVDFAVSGGTATSGDDYTIADQSLTFAAGETVKSVTMSIVADDIEEGNETVILRLSNASGAKLGISQQEFTISEQGPLLRGAFYFRDDNDSSAKVGPHADIMVRLGDGDNKLIFRRNKGYLPVWSIEDSGEQDLPVEVNRSSCENTVNRYSRVEIIETSPARAIVHWRYAANCSRSSMSIRDWVDEYFTVYPDGACIRSMRIAAGTNFDQWLNIDPVVRNVQLLDEGVADLPASWLDPANLVLNSGDYSNEGFNEAQRCYTLQSDVTAAPTTLNCTLDTSGGKSIHNPAIVVKNWGDAEAQVTVNGSEPTRYYTGYAPDMYGDHLVVWLGVESGVSLDVTITPQGGSGQFAGRAKPPVHSYEFNDSPPLPLGSPEPGKFGAYYSRLRFNNVFDSEFRHGEHADVVVQFDDNAHRFVFWRGTNYQPHWAGDTSETPENPHVGQGVGIPGLPYSCWYGTEFLERRGGEWDLDRYLEPMSDQRCRYTHVRIISSNAARAIVQWRYAPCMRDYQTNANGGDPWGDWVDEYYTIYPDAISVRHLIGWSRRTGGSDDENPHFEYHEAMPITNPGTVPEDNIHLNAVSATNYSGSKKDWVWQDRCGGGPDNLNEMGGRAIQVFRLKGSTVPITITDGPPTLDPMSGLPDCRLFNHYDDWPAWPDAARSYKENPSPTPPEYGSWWDDDDSTCCYRNFWKYCPSHCSTYHVKWRSWVHIQDKRKEKIMLYGMYDADEAQNVNNLIPLASSWEYAPGLSISSSGFSGGSYEKTERAYKIRRDSEQATELQFTMNASSDSPVYNPCFVIENWDAEATLTVDGQEVADVRQGIEKDADEVASLVVWLRQEAEAPINITISAVSKGCACPGNLNADDQIDLEDLQAVAGILLDAGSPFIVPVEAGHCGNMNDDLQIDLEDLQAVAGILLDAGSPFIAACD